jgi:hypothetical protein
MSPGSSGNILVEAATSRELTGDEYRVYIKFRKKGGRIDARTDVIMSIPAYGIPNRYRPSIKSDFFPSPEDYWNDFAGSLGDIKKWFYRPGTSELNCAYSSLLSLANPHSNSSPRISGEALKTYWPSEEGEFLFLDGPFSHLRFEG